MLTTLFLAVALQQGAPVQPLKGAPSATVDRPALRLTDLEDWRAHLLPSAADLRFAQVAWAPTFMDGVQQASELQRPLLLWLMNGHPLGCT